MKPKPGLPQNVRLSELLGCTWRVQDTPNLPRMRPTVPDKLGGAERKVEQASGFLRPATPEAVLKCSMGRAN